MLSVGSLALACQAPTSSNPERELGALCEGASAVRDASQAAILTVDRFGSPTFMSGDLGCLGDDGDPSEAAWAFLESLTPVIAGTGAEQWVAVEIVEDEVGLLHARFDEYLNGLPVIGAQYVVHADPGTRVVQALNGRFAPADETLGTSAAIPADEAFATALPEAGIDSSTPAGTARLVYYTGEGQPLALAWEQHIRYANAVNGANELDIVFADAHTGALLARHPQIHSGKNRRIYHANYGNSLPGTLTVTEGGSSSDSVIQAAYVNAGATYDFYADRLGRDSFNGSGADVRVTVHYGNGYNNAYWNGQQLVFGDGDGSQFGPFGNALDIMAHEFTHGVITYTADLTYYGESGALNEGWADVMGASAEAYADGGVSSSTWDLGEDCTTPGVGGDALRYMDDPTDDGYSRDYYPERYTGGGDNGGVHSNSGIANLAYVLLVQGGSHPRGKTSVNVSGIGITKSEKIFYRALRHYMTSSTNFEGARNATAQAAADLYGSSEVASVQQAWNAVGVPGGPVDPDPDPPTVTELNNGQIVSGVSGGQGDWSYYKLAVPTGQDSIVFEIQGGSGDADLYVRFGALPTTAAYDHRPYLNGNNESVSVNNPAAGDWFIGVRAYSAYSGLSVTAEYASENGNPGGDPDPNPEVVTLENGITQDSLAGAKNTWTDFKIVVPAGVSTLEIRTWGGAGDADLYVRAGQLPTTTEYDHRPYKWGNNETVTISSPAAGTYYVSLRGYAAFSGVNLKAEH